jgi:hypothetical protein
MANKQDKQLVDQINQLAGALQITPPDLTNQGTQQLEDTLTALQKLKAERDGGGTQGTSGGAQTTDPAQSKSLPGSEPDEIAPIPGQVAAKGKPEPSASGYRVAPGKSLTGARGDLHDAGAEISEKDVAGGAERLTELEKLGYVVKTDRKPSEPAQPAESGQSPGGGTSSPTG